MRCRTRRAASVEQHPVSAFEALDLGIAKAGFFHRRDDLVADRRDMAVRAPGGDHHMIGDGGFTLYVNGDNRFSFRVVKTGQDRVKRKS